MTEEQKVEELEHNEAVVEAAEELEESEKRVYSLRSRVAFLIASILAASFLLLISVPGFFDNSALKFKIEQKLSQTLKTNFTINGNVKVDLFPMPQIELNDVLVKNIRYDKQFYSLYSKSITLRLSFLSFLQKEFVISKIIFDNPVFEIFYEENNAITRNNKFSEITAKFAQVENSSPTNGVESGFSADLFLIEKFNSNQFSESSIPKIKFENGTIISYDKFSHQREIEEINGQLMVDSTKIRSEGTFTNQKVLTEFKLSANFNSDSEEPDSTLELKSATMNMKISGKFTAENKGILTSNFTGKIDTEIFELRNFYRDYLGNNKAIFEKLKQNSHPIKISSHINNKAGEINFEDIAINSELMNGKGYALLDLTSNLPRIDLNLTFENLDLDNIWSNERVEIEPTTKEKKAPNQNDETLELASLEQYKTTQTTEKDGEQTGKNDKEKIADNNKLNLEIANKIKDFDLSAEIKINDVKFINGIIKDVSLYTTISKEGQILILPMIFKIPGEGTVRINGVLENDQDLPKFVGKIDLNGKNLGETLKWLNLQSQNLKFDNLKDYIIYSDILLFPNLITMDNFYLNMNEGQSELRGKIAIDSSNKTTIINNEFHVSTFNIDDFFLTSGQNVYLSSGSLLKKLLWLNDITTVTEISLTFDNLIYKGDEFSENAAVKISFGQGYLNIKDLNIKSNKSALQGSLSLDISDQNPVFNLQLFANSFYYDSSKIITKQITEESFENDSLKEVKESKYNVADQFLSLPSLEGFSGAINMAINYLKLDDVEIQKAKLNGKIKDGSISDGEVDCEIYDSIFKYRGMIGLRGEKIINGNITMNNVALEKLLPDLVGIKNISGNTNISASMTAIGAKKSDFVKSLMSEIKFSTATPIIHRYGLTDLVNKLFYYNSYRKELLNPEQILSNSASKSVFKQANGTISFDKEKGGKVLINLIGTTANSVLSGKIDLNTQTIDATHNIIFITGSRQKQIPITVASAIKGDIANVQVNSNLDQVRQYLGLPTLNKSAPAITNQNNSNNSAKNSSGQNNAINKINPETTQKAVFDQINSETKQPVKKAQ